MSESTMTPAPFSEKSHDSVVDKVFDVAFAKTAQALVAAKHGLEASARWLEGRAKFVGELAKKLETDQTAKA
jgi:hypothetical protein